MDSAYLEFTTCIGCKIGCLKYCPQEAVIANYEGEKVLSLEKFKQYLETVPTSTGIIFGGIVEPFQNPDCAEMIIHAHEKGHHVELLSTLTGLKYKDAVRMKDIPFTRIVLHLPDPLGNAHIPFTDDYKNCLPFFLKTFRNLTVMKMDECFKSNRVEDMHRGLAPLRIPERVHCDYHSTSIYYCMPNGKVYFCCMMRGIKGYIGSLEETTYQAIYSKYREQSYGFATAEDSMCHICSYGKPYWKYKLVEWKNAHLGEKPLMLRLVGDL